MIQERDKNKFLHSKERPQKQSGGWFSCFSSTAVDYPTPNMRNQDDDNTFEERQKYNREFGQMGVGKYDNSIQITKTSYAESYPYQKVNKSLATSPQGNMQKFKEQQKFRLKHGITYQPTNEQQNHSNFNNMSTLSRTFQDTSKHIFKSNQSYLGNDEYQKNGFHEDDLNREIKVQRVQNYQEYVPSSNKVKDSQIFGEFNNYSNDQQDLNLKNVLFNQNKIGKGQQENLKIQRSPMRNNDNKKKFWTSQLIDFHSNIAQLALQDSIGKKANPLYLNNLLSERYNYIVQKYEHLQKQASDDIYQSFINSQIYPAHQQMSEQEYQDAQNEAHWDIAWQSFDEVNEFNDVQKLINLNCLSVDDSLAITKQKLFDVAQFLHTSQQFQDIVFTIICSEHHIMPQEGYLQDNIILDMIDKELNLDHYYVPQKLFIFVKITFDTINHPVLQQW